ncbi:hypothetical protein PHMEG_00041857, partial [Phytophthora megakarya]
MLLPEAAVATLSSPLRGLVFSSSAYTQPDQDVDDDELIKYHARHAKSIIYQKNTLKLLALSTTIFKGGISWSTELFGGNSAVVWLPHFFEYILKTEFGEGALRVELLLTHLEELTQKAGEKALREAYWLAALLNTALVACSNRSAGAYADLEEAIQGRLFMPFSHWLSGALVYSQSFLEEVSPTMRQWERTFTSYVTDLYLHIEFEEVTCELLK